MTQNSRQPISEVTSPLSVLQRHSAYRLADGVAACLGIGRDWIAFMETLSLGAGRRVMPMNLDIVTDQWAVDLAIADRILAILPDAVAIIDAYRQFLAEEQNRFEERNVLLNPQGLSETLS